MIRIIDLIDNIESYIEHVFKNIDWDGLRDEGLADEDERMHYFLFEATNNWIYSFDFVDFIQDNYKINDIEDVITGKTVCDLIQQIHSYHMDECGECYIDLRNLTVKEVINNWGQAYIHNANTEKIRERIREEIMLFVGENELERFLEDSYEIGYK